MLILLDYSLNLLINSESMTFVRNKFCYRFSSSAFYSVIIYHPGNGSLHETFFPHKFDAIHMHSLKTPQR